MNTERTNRGICEMTKPSLAHNASDEAFAEAMVRCQGFPPACSDAGRCEHDGMCFSASGRGFKTARAAMVEMITMERDVHVRSWLKLALDALDQNQFLERGSLDAMRYVTIQKRVRRMYAEGRLCT